MSDVLKGVKYVQTPPTIYRLSIQRFRGIKTLTWNPAKGVNVILGGGDVGKTTVLEAIGFLLSPTYPTALSDSDYYNRDIGSEFAIEGLFSLPPESGINSQTKPSWPWEWNGKEAVVPSTDAGSGLAGESVYYLRVRGTAELELAYEIVQLDGTTDTLPVALLRSIGLVRLSGDDRNDRDLRIVQGSALDRLLSDKALRSRLATEFAKYNVKDELTDAKKEVLKALDSVFKANNLPGGLDLAITSSQGLSITALIGLTAERENVQLPLASWGAGTRRIAALTIAEQNQGEAPITLAAGVFSWHVHPLRVQMGLSIPSYHSVIFTNASFSEVDSDLTRLIAYVPRARERHLMEQKAWFVIEAKIDVAVYEQYAQRLIVFPEKEDEDIIRDRYRFKRSDKIEWR